MKILRIFVGSIGILFLITSLLFGYEESYGIITGSKVQFRVKPDLKSKVHRHFFEGELVVYSGLSDNKMKIGNSSDYWYKVKTMDNKEGWVYGKYYHHIDDRIKEGELFNKIIHDWLLSEYTTTRYKKSIIKKPFNSIIYDVNLKYLRDDRYIIFNYNELTRNGDFQVIDGFYLLYKVQSDNVNLVIYTTPSELSFYKMDKYILLYDKIGIKVYSTSEYVKIGYYPIRKDEVFKKIDRIHLRQVIKDITKFHDSYIEFDKEKKKAIMHLRLKKDEPMQKRVYKFKDGKFILIEDE